jgi:hypothetical protein
MLLVKPAFHTIIYQYKKWDLLLFTFITALAVVFGQTTIFYIIYFFWWTELIRILAVAIYGFRNESREEKQVSLSIFGPLFMMAIYFVFIVIFFGVIASWGNEEVTMVNMGILFFQNWFFNVNLIIVALEQFLFRGKQSNSLGIGPFTPPILVLHISIVLGGILMFFVVKNFPNIFSPQNLWGSLLIISPFLLLKYLMYNFLKPIS